MSLEYGVWLGSAVRREVQATHFTTAMRCTGHQSGGILGGHAHSSKFEHLEARKVAGKRTDELAASNFDVEAEAQITKAAIHFEHSLMEVLKARDCEAAAAQRQSPYGAKRGQARHEGRGSAFSEQTHRVAVQVEVGEVGQASDCCRRTCES